MSSQAAYDVVVIGSGAAGLTVALHAPPHLRVAVVAKGPLEEGSTFYAQGGISAVLDESDSVESHIEDTLQAGAGLCDPAIVRYAVSGAAPAVDWLIGLGVRFTRDEGGSGHGYHLTREGGHSHRRVVHAADTTGQAMENALVDAARAAGHITVLANRLAVDLITPRHLGRDRGRCLGVYVLDRQQGHVDVLRARAVVLATGGANKAYLYTSNPDSSTGDGIAMAWRAGCHVANLEFIQFHPTCLFHPEAKSFLITESLRGEGARLLLPDGTPVMEGVDPRGELAPRDIVARAIDYEMKRRGLDYVHLDISHKPAAFIREHFPNVHRQCLKYGFDITRGPIPVVPAAHYTCGGVVTDHRGRTDLPGLYAVGEVAHTGLHGANRMASNSLLECIVFGQAVARDLAAHLEDVPMPDALPEWDESRVTDSDEEVVVAHNWDELRRFMWDYVGIVRTSKRLQRAQHRIDLLLREIDDYYGNFRISDDLIELRNLALVSSLIIECAQRRRESRGLHYTLDYPYPDNSQAPRDTVVTPRGRIPRGANARVS